jgi:hypothetical protein
MTVWARARKRSGGRLLSNGPPEALLERCAAKIEREAPTKDQADLLAVAQVLAELRFPHPELLGLLGERIPMLESPMLKKVMAKGPWAVKL